MRTERLLAALPCLLLAGWLSLPAAALEVDEWRTPEGVRVLFVADSRLPMLDLRLAFAAGSGFDPAGNSGLAALTAGLIGHGGRDYDERAVSERLADVGAELDTSVDRDRALLSLRSLSDAAALDVALSVLEDQLNRPAFAEEVLERERQRLISVLRDMDTRPDAIARRAFFATLYPDHPYGHPVEGEVDELPGIDAGQLHAFWRHHYRADAATAVLVGDVNRQKAEDIVRRLTTGLVRRGEPPRLPALVGGPAGPQRLIDHPASQSHILLGLPALRRGDPDFFALSVGNYILGGGGFASRLLEEVREKRGLAYSAYSGFMPLRQPGPFLVGVQTRREQTGEALEVVRQVLAGFIEEGPTEQELEDARNHLILSFPLQFDSNADIAGMLTTIGFYDLPPDYLDTWTERIGAVGREDVIAAFRRHVPLNRLSGVVVGGAP